MSGGKTGSQSNDYYGHIAGVVCCGNLDFIGSFMLDNDVVWPKAKSWESQIHQKNKKVIYTGNVYKTPAITDVDPPAAPWMLYAITWAAGTTLAGDKKLYLGNVWTAAVNTNTNPPATAPASILAGNTQPKLGVQDDTVIGDWIYDCTPPAFSGATHFWAANSIVAHNNRLWINSADTNKEPGTDPVWTLWKKDLTGGPNPLKFTVEDHGDVYIYYGTGTQTLDTVDEQILNALGHPPYRHRTVVMLKNFLLGSSTTTAPNITLIGGRKPVQSIIIDNSGAVGVDATAMDDDWQVNPWCILAELLTHPAFGLGLPASWFDAASWQAEADRCAAHPELYYISPIYTSLKKVREAVSDIMDYPDAFVFWSTLAKLTAGHWPHHEAAPAFTAATTIDRNDMIDELRTNSSGWGGTSNSIAVSFRDIEAGFSSRPAFAPNLFNRTIVRRLVSQKIDRPHISRFNQALAWATEFAKIAGEQTFACSSLTVRAEKAASIQPGSLFLLTDDQLGFSQIMRCTKKTIAAAGTGKVILHCELERGAAPQPYAPTPDASAAPSGPPPATIANYAAVQLPAALAGLPNALAILAGRENESTSSMEVWFRAEDAAAFQQLGTSRGFAVAGTLLTNANSEITTGTPGSDNVTLVNVGQVTQGHTYDLGNTDFWRIQLFYSVNSGGFPFFVGVEGTDYTVDPITGILTILTGGNIPTNYYVNVKLWQKLVLIYNPNTPQADLDVISVVPTQDEIEDGKILLFAFKGDNPAQFEIMSVRAIQAVGLDVVINRQVLFVEVLRSQFGTSLGGDGSYVWGTSGNDVIMIIQKSDIAALTHQNFPFYHANQSTIHLRLAPASAWEQADITDLFDAAANPSGLATAFDYTFNNLYAPVTTFGQLLKNGAAIGTFATNFAAADVFSFSFQIDSREGNLVHGALVAIQGQQEITLWSTNMPPSDTYNKTVDFSLPKGNWRIEVRALDDSGNQSSTPLTEAGALATVYVDNGTAAAPIIYSYTDHNGYRTQLLFGLLPGVAANFLVKYQIQDRNDPVNGAAWINCAVDGAAIGGLYRWGDATYVTLPPIKKGSSGQTLYAYCTQTGKTGSAVVKWNF
jgi:hypothetical protein